LTACSPRRQKSRDIPLLTADPAFRHFKVRTPWPPAGTLLVRDPP